MALTGYKSWAVTDSGNIIASAAIEVRRKADNTLASLFTDAGGGTPVANPFTAGSDGSFEFYADPDRYDLLVGTGPSQVTVPVDLTDGRAQVPFEDRAAFVAWVAGGGTAADGTIKSDGTVQYVASTGATAIADMPGWLPFADVSTRHFAENSVPGTTDMTAAINAADAYCAANGLELHWTGDEHLVDPATAQLTPSAGWVGEANLTVAAKGVANNSPAILCSIGFSFHTLTLSFGANNARGIKFQGCDGYSLTATNSAYNAGDDSIDACIEFSGTGNRVRFVTASNHSRLVNNSGTATVIEKFTGTDYVQGFLNGNDFTRVGAISCTVKNVNATGAAGENGLLHQVGNYCHYGHVYVQDSGEHSVRLGGAASYTGVVFDTVVGINPSGNAFKVRPDATFNANFKVNKIIAEDCGSGTLTVNAQDVGVLVERCLDSSIGTVEVRKNVQSKSCFSALEVNAISGLSVDYLYASDVAYSFVSVRTEDGDTNDLTVSNMLGSNSDDVAVSIVYPGTGNDIRDIRVSGESKGVANASIRVVDEIDGTFTAADYTRSGVDPGGSGLVSQTCWVDLISDAATDIDGNGTDRKNIVYSIKERKGSSTLGPGKLVDMSAGRGVYYLNNIADDGVATIELPPRQSAGTISVSENISAAGAYGLSSATVSTAASSDLGEHVASNASATATNGTLTGATGTDGTLNYRLDGSTLYVENRRGTVVDVVVKFDMLQTQ